MALGDECSNDGFTDRWTCPTCYTDMPNNTRGTFKCDGCGDMIECSVYMKPCANARVVYSPAMIEEDHNGPFDDGEPKPGEDCLGTEPVDITGDDDDDMSAFARELDRDG